MRTVILPTLILWSLLALPGGATALPTITQDTAAAETSEASSTPEAVLLDAFGSAPEHVRPALVAAGQNLGPSARPLQAAFAQPDPFTPTAGLAAMEAGYKLDWEGAVVAHDRDDEPKIKVEGEDEDDDPPLALPGTFGPLRVVDAAPFADVNGDGHAEVLAATLEGPRSRSAISVLDGREGGTLWSARTDGGLTIQISDVTGDQIADVLTMDDTYWGSIGPNNTFICCDHAWKIAVFSGSDGALQWHRELRGDYRSEFVGLPGVGFSWNWDDTIRYVRVHVLPGTTSSPPRVLLEQIGVGISVTARGLVVGPYTYETEFRSPSSTDVVMADGSTSMTMADEDPEAISLLHGVGDLDGDGMPDFVRETARHPAARTICVTADPSTCQTATGASSFSVTALSGSTLDPAWTFTSAQEDSRLDPYDYIVDEPGRRRYFEAWPSPDATGDGVPDVLVTERGTMTMLSGDDGGPAWSAPLAADDAFDLPGDVDGDGSTDVVRTARGAGGAMAVDRLDGRTGDVLFSTTHEDGLRVHAIPDIDGDGVRDLEIGRGVEVVTSSTIESGRSGIPRAMLSHPGVVGGIQDDSNADGARWHRVGNVGDFNGDGSDDALLRDWDSAPVAAYDLHDDRRLWTLDDTFGPGARVGADHDRDGRVDVLHLEQGEEGGLEMRALVVRSGKNRKELWRREAPLNTSTLELTHDYAPWQAEFVADLDGDGHQDILTGGFGDAGSAIGAISGRDGTDLWTRPSSPCWFWPFTAVPDITGDGRPDMLATCKEALVDPETAGDDHRWHVQARSGVTGEVQWERVYDGYVHSEVGLKNQYFLPEIGAVYGPVDASYDSVNHTVAAFVGPDHDGDGVPEVVIQASSVGHAQTMSVRIGTSDGPSATIGREMHFEATTAVELIGADGSVVAAVPDTKGDIARHYRPAGDLVGDERTDMLRLSARHETLHGQCTSADACMAIPGPSTFTVEVVDGATLTPAWSWEVGEPVSRFSDDRTDAYGLSPYDPLWANHHYDVRLLGDVDADGADDLAAFQGREATVISAGTGTPLWAEEVDRSTSLDDIGDVDADGADDVMRTVLDLDGTRVIERRRGSDGELLSSSDHTSDEADLLEAHSMRMDFDGDGVHEVALAHRDDLHHSSAARRCELVSGATGEVLVSFAMQPWASKSFFSSNPSSEACRRTWTFSSPGDVDADGLPDLLVGIVDPVSGFSIDVVDVAESRSLWTEHATDRPVTDVFGPASAPTPDDPRPRLMRFALDRIDGMWVRMLSVVDGATGETIWRRVAPS